MTELLSPHFHGRPHPCLYPPAPLTSQVQLQVPGRLLEAPPPPQEEALLAAWEAQLQGRIRTDRGDFEDEAGKRKEAGGEELCAPPSPPG